MLLTDWSADGNFLIFQDDCAGVLHVLPLSGGQNARKEDAIEWLRDVYNVGVGRLSPDSRFMTYLSDEIEAETFQVYVRPFDPSRADVSAGGAKPVQVSTAGAQGMIFWRQGRQGTVLPDSRVGGDGGRSCHFPDASGGIAQAPLEVAGAIDSREPVPFG
jgi:hypothetical protein